VEIKLNFEGMKKAVDTYDIYDDELNSIKEDLVDIITDVDDYWIGRCGNSFKYICWYLKLLLDINDRVKTQKMKKGLKSIAKDFKKIAEYLEDNNLDINDYRSGLLYFYETEQYTRYADYFLQNKLKYLQKYTDKDLMIHLQK